MSRTRLAAAVAAVAVVAAPVAADARRDNDNRRSNRSANNCRPHHPVFEVTGTLQSFTPDTSGTDANEAALRMTVRNANRHARRSGELTDVDPSRRGVQVRGGTFEVDNDSDRFRVRLLRFETGETPAAGDRVRVSGRITLAKRRCSPNTSLADRYGELNVKRVRIVDATD
jgi:hypothetical protein